MASLSSEDFRTLHSDDEPPTVSDTVLAMKATYSLRGITVNITIRNKRCC